MTLRDGNSLSEGANDCTQTSLRLKLRSKGWHGEREGQIEKDSKLLWTLYKSVLKLLQPVRRGQLE